MNCAEFQKVLPYIIETGGNAEEEAHLRVCSVCSDLVTDLRYIAEQAKLLLPMHEPGPQVWDNIQGSLEREGLVKPARARGRLLGSTGESTRWILAASAAILVAALLFLTSRGHNLTSPEGNNASGTALTQTSSHTQQNEFSAHDDEQLLTAVAQARPQLRETYASNLKQVNANISDAEQLVKEDPNDEQARQHLANAYGQKAMIYEMATRFSQ